MDVSILHPLHLLSRPVPSAQGAPTNAGPSTTKIKDDTNQLRLRDLPMSISGSTEYHTLDNMPISISLNAARLLTLSSPAFHIQREAGHWTFDAVCSDPSVTLNPRRLGFAPACAWNQDSYSFGAFVKCFFRKHNSVNCNFMFKLFNALRISENCSELKEFVGVEWVTDVLIRVKRVEFARLLGIKTIEGGLFNQQGNFPSHGFVELSYQESVSIAKQLGQAQVDLSVERYIHHAENKLTRYSTEADVQKCRWKPV